MEKILEVNRYGNQWILESEEQRLKDVDEKRNRFLCVLPRKNCFKYST